MKKIWLAMAVAVLPAFTAFAEGPQAGEDTQVCLDCHRPLHPGIVADWEKSRHAHTTPAAAMAVKGAGRKVSSSKVPEKLLDKTVGCAECHTLRPDAHKDTFEHNGFRIHVVVTPADCSECHAVEAEQFEKNLMSRARENLLGNDVYGLLMDAINGQRAWKEKEIVRTPANEAIRAESCLYCHGTKLEVTGKVTRETTMGEMTFPVIKGWPNQGTGRINPDGSSGACSACHARHGFSIEMARKPYTCKECHVGPDVPAFKVYSASKHGNLFSSHGSEWNFNAVPWRVGMDFKAPTCAACHMSLLATPEGEVVIERSHEVKNRLPYRIFGLIYAHPHPLEADTTRIRNRDGLQLPTDFDGNYAEEYLAGPKEREKRKNALQAACLACHHRPWVDGHWARFENTMEETNAATAAATGVMGEVWKNGLAEGLSANANPFDEFPERLWADNWLFYANTVRFASAMAGGGDYGVFAGGRYQLSGSIAELADWWKARKRQEK